MLYLFKNDFITIVRKNGKEKASGYYRSVDHIDRGTITCRATGAPTDFCVTIGKGDTVKKHAVSVLGKTIGEIGGRQKCSEQFPLTPEKE